MTIQRRPRGFLSAMGTGPLGHRSRSVRRARGLGAEISCMGGTRSSAITAVVDTITAAGGNPASWRPTPHLPDPAHSAQLVDSAGAVDVLGQRRRLLLFGPLRA